MGQEVSALVKQSHWPVNIHRGISLLSSQVSQGWRRRMPSGLVLKDKVSLNAPGYGKEYVLTTRMLLLLLGLAMRLMLLCLHGNTCCPSVSGKGWAVPTSQLQMRYTSLKNFWSKNRWGISYLIALSIRCIKVGELVLVHTIGYMPIT